jgi:hypothetical protein
MINQTFANAIAFNINQQKIRKRFTQSNLLKIETHLYHLKMSNLYYSNIHMKLYIGNNFDYVIDVDEDDDILICPTTYSMGGVWDIRDRKTWRVICWDGIKHTTAHFSYIHCEQDKTSMQQKAETFYRENHKNKIQSCFAIKANQITSIVTDKFRFVQPIIDYQYQDVPIDPRMLGIWLGDGSTSTTSTTTITNVDQEVIDYIRSYAFQNNFRVSENVTEMQYSIVTEPGKPNPFRGALRQLNVFDDKHIPECYLKNSREVRLNLLAGLIDTDGSLKGNQWEIIQGRHQLAEQIVELSRSLGLFTTVRDKWACATNTEKKTKRLYKRIYISVNHTSLNVPVIVKHKQVDKSKMCVIQLLDLTKQTPNIKINGPMK